MQKAVKADRGLPTSSPSANSVGAIGGLPCLCSSVRLGSAMVCPRFAGSSSHSHFCSCSSSQPSGSSARGTRTRLRATSATSRRAPSSASRVSMAFSAARHPRAAAGCSTSPTSASRRTPTPKTSRGDEAVLSRDNLKIAFRVHTVWRVDDAQSAAVHGALQHDA